MGNFNKKQAFSIGGGLAVLASIIAVAANISEIIQLFRGDDKPEVSTSARTQIVEETVVEQADVIEAENIAEASPMEAQPSVVYLNSLKVTESSNSFFDNKSSAEDTIGNTYIEHLLVIGKGGYYGDNYATYYLGGKYKTLSGIIAVNDDYDQYNPQSVLSILCDDNCVYTTGQVERTFVPTKFSIDVENCQWLKISQVPYGDNTGVSFILADWKLE